MTAQRPNVLVIMTDEERYPPPYEDATLGQWRREHLVARERIRNRGVELHRHYTASTACVPSRASLFTGQYPSLHGVDQTDGLTKAAADSTMTWLDPDGVPTLGDWFRAAGYRTFYKGKWHISHADIPVAGHQGLMASDATGALLPDGIEAYRVADRLDPYGFSGWIGREPHGADQSDNGVTRDPVFAQQVLDLFDQLQNDDDGSPWLAVASFVNPHDIAFSGPAWSFLGFPPIPDDIPSVPEAPSQSDGFEHRPAAQKQFRDVWPIMLFPQPCDDDYRRLYLWLHEMVDPFIGQVLDGLAASGMEDDTIVVFTSDHGDMMGSHGGMQQKWHTAFDEAIRVPLLVAGPGIEQRDGGYSTPTSHIDLVPTLLGLAGIDVDEAADTIAKSHVETHLPVGRDLAPLLRGEADEATVDAPVYFMTDDQISRGLRQVGGLSGQPFDPVETPDKLEAIITTRPTGEGGTPELWKLTHFFDRLIEWEEAHGVVPAIPPIPVDHEWELYNLTADPEERTNLASNGGPVFDGLRDILHAERETKRLTPRHRNPAP